jgi:hypothetical protein
MLIERLVSSLGAGGDLNPTARAEDPQRLACFGISLLAAEHSHRDVLGGDDILAGRLAFGLYHYGFAGLDRFDLAHYDIAGLRR